MAFAPDARAQTVSPGYQVWIWTFVADPVELSAAGDGTLYSGRDLSGSGGGSDDPTWIHQISLTAAVSPFGPSLDDPDVVMFDAAGDVAPVPGSILVGGRDKGVVPLRGRVTAIAPDESATVIFGPTTAITNPAGLAIDAMGRLLLADYDTGDVLTIDGGSSSILINGPPLGPIDILVHPVSGDLYVSWGDGVIRRYTSTGALLDGAFASGRAMEFGPGNATFGTDLYTVNNATGVLQRIDPAKNVTVIGSGFQSVWGLTFGSDGAMYLTEFSRDRVMRVSCAPATATVDDLMLARVDGGANIRFTWSDVAGATDYVVFQHSLPVGPFTTQTGSAASGVPGLMAPVPPGTIVFFQVGARDACGVGPLN
jgi:hypothetical protein